MPEAPEQVRLYAGQLTQKLERTFDCDFWVVISAIMLGTPPDLWRIAFYPYQVLRPEIDPRIQPNALTIYDEVESAHRTTLFYDRGEARIFRDQLRLGYQLDPATRLQVVVVFDPVMGPVEPGPDPKSLWAHLNEEDS